MLEIRKAIAEDAEKINEIYSYYVLNTHHTFETELLTLQQMEKRIREFSRMNPFLVVILENEIVGYAYALQYKQRPAYKFSVESSIYLAQNQKGKNIGSELYGRLITEIFETAAHTIIAGIALPNEASIKLHEKLGFVKTAYFPQVGFKFGEWIDVGYWQIFNPNDNSTISNK